MPHKAVSFVADTEGVGFTKIENEIGVPTQLPTCGVTVIFAVWLLVGLVVVKFKLPFPEAAKPMLGLSFVHE